MTFFITYMLIGLILTVITIGWTPNNEQKTKLIEYGEAIKKDLISNKSIVVKIAIGLILIVAILIIIFMMPLSIIFGNRKKI